MPHPWTGGRCQEEHHSLQVGHGESPDGLLAFGGILKLLGSDLVHKVTQSLLDDVEGDLLGVASSAAGPLHRSCGQAVEGHNVLQHVHRLHTTYMNGAWPEEDYHSLHAIAEWCGPAEQ